MSRHFLLYVVVKVAELWDRLTWLRGRSFGLLRTTSWTLTQVGLEVSKVLVPSAPVTRKSLDNCEEAHFCAPAFCYVSRIKKRAVLCRLSATHTRTQQNKTGV